MKTAILNKRPILTPAECNLYPDEQGCDLVEDFSVEASNGKTYTIPAGFWFNGGSIPAAFWQATFTPFDMRVIDFFLFHDWAYTSHCCDKRTADDTLQAGIRSQRLDTPGRSGNYCRETVWRIKLETHKHRRALSAPTQAANTAQWARSCYIHADLICSELYDIGSISSYAPSSLRPDSACRLVVLPLSVL